MTAPAPAVFADLAGQEAAVAQLRRAAAEDRPTHAWMFTGPPGSGRSTAARAFAAALQCEVADPAARGCGECHACRTVLGGSLCEAHAHCAGPASADFLHLPYDCS